MSLQALWSVPLTYPAQILNALALLMALAGSWLLLATQRRRSQFKLRLVQGNFQEALMLAARHRVDGFFTRFGALSLALAVTLSWVSTGL
ncbi:hypothetical protein [Pseudomonas flexibilis]|uniref:Uncharacterized protein n=1 Tax=Pseudomonas flexibilis TaxID=706570 RepID=A0A0B3BRT7_9PSED|nr:hypothetical protein [Pseudomonas flexibilis]KHL71010.1 hypothetical protein SF06_04200 [Pseudomonas flexibilis]KHO65320.1 hypothetical protein PT85_04315 [Pseudomonas flexibilis]SCX86110.1 hypothetical protein SAMN02927929_00717 [Pseudomonas flexibilis]SIP91812.1 hypothetical protein SAMN05421672_101297 [Pseudomonas flexibilis]